MGKATFQIKPEEVFEPVHNKIITITESDLKNYSAKITNISNNLLVTIKKDLNYDEKIWISTYIYFFHNLNKNFKNTTISFRLNKRNLKYHILVNQFLKIKIESKELILLQKELEELI